ncbi:MAG: 4Fe-4S binding protein [Bacteroidales bacterium]|nr:4Fe-4S binding protein [Bacteroidales bacterium]
MADHTFHHALKILEEVCIGCTHCMQACPTEALRVRNGKAVLNKNKCVDCGECMRVCPVNAITVEQDDFEDIFKFKVRIALVPSVFIGQFARNIPTRKIYSSILEQGFTHVYEAEHGVNILINAVNSYLDNRKEIRPVISSFCPAIVRMIQVRFPNLAENIMLLKAPLDIAALSYRKVLNERGYNDDEIGIYYITPCAAKIAAVKSPVGELSSAITGVIRLDSLYNKVYSSIKKEVNSSCIVPEKEQLKPREMTWSLTGGESRFINGRSLAIDGINNAIEFLEKIENGSISNFDFIELRACDESCAGGILSANNRFLVSERLKERAKQYKLDKKEGKIINNKTIRQNTEYLLDHISIDEVKARSGLMLDEDMNAALKKMEKIRQFTNYLPGIDCAACGAPSCKTLAEDIVQGNAKTLDCIFVQYAINRQESSEKMNDQMEKIWGTEKLNKLAGS